MRRLGVYLRRLRLRLRLGLRLRLWAGAIMITAGAAVVVTAGAAVISAGLPAAGAVVIAAGLLPAMITSGLLAGLPAAGAGFTLLLNELIDRVADVRKTHDGAVGSKNHAGGYKYGREQRHCAE